MANNRENLGNDGLDLGVLDLDSVGSEFNLDKSSIDTSGPVKRFTVGFKRGFRDSFKPTAFLKNTFRSSLPDGYSRTISAIGATRSISQDILEEIKRSNTSDLELIANQVDKALPHLKGRTSDKIYGKIETRLDKIKQELRDLRHTQMRSTTGEVDKDEVLLKELLGGMSSTQVDIATAQQQNDEIRYVKERKERAIRDKFNNVRFDAIHRQLNTLTEMADRQVSFQDQVTYNFQRKSLEAQYRSLFMLRDIRKLTEMAVDVNKQAYDALIHNTALPDHQKTTQASRVKFNLQQNFSRSVSDKISENLPNFLSNFYPAISQNVTKGLQGLLTKTGGVLGNASMLDMFGNNKAGGVGQIVGGLASSQLARGLSASAASKLKPLFGKASDKLGGHHHRLEYLLQNAPGLLRDYTTDIGQSGGMRGKLQDLVRSVVPSYYQNTEITGGGYGNLDQQVGFNQLTQRSIVEVIPGYLSRILHEIRMGRTGDTSIEREVYDITSGRFTGYSEAKSSLLNRIITPQSRQMVSSGLEDALANLDKDNTLSPEAKSALRERLMRDAMTGGRFDPKRYAEGGYGSNVSESSLQELNALFKGQYAFDEQGSMLKTPENYKKLNQFNQLFGNLQNVSPDIRKELSRLTGAGSSELMRDLGLMTSERGRDFVNYDNVSAQYRQTGTMVTEPRRVVSSSNVPVEDVYSDPNGSHLIMKAVDVQSGQFVDEETGKPIRSFEDITGPVKDRLGRVVLTTNEVTQNLYTRSGIKVHLPNILDKFKQFGKAAYGATKGIGNFLHKTALSVIDRMGDLYVLGKDKAVLLTRDMRMGQYIDVNTQKVVKSVKDITGAVMDRMGNIVITQEEFTDGLYDATGNKASAVWAGVNRYLEITTSPAKAMFGMLKKGITAGAKALWSGVRRQVDAYVAGESVPRILINKLHNGFYVDAKSGKPLYSFEDIKGQVMDINGNVVLNEEEIPQLVDRKGDKHPIAKKRGLLYKATIGLAGKMLRGVGKFAAGYWKAVAKPYYKWLGGKVLPKWMTSGKGDAKEFKQMTPTDGILSRILGMLETRLPGGQLRKGSWQEILANRKNKATDPTKPTTEKEKGKGLFGGLTSGLAKLFGFGKDKEEEEDDGLGVEDLLDSDILDGDGRKRKGRLGKKAKIPKGKLGKLLSGTKKVGGKILSGGKKLLGPAGRLLGGAGRMLLPLASGAGSAIAGAAGTALSATGTALSAAGTAIAGVLSAPVVIGAAIVAGAAIGGYMYYKKRQATKGAFRELRLAQYGVSPKGWSNAGKVLEIEAMFETVTSKGPGYPTLDLGRLDLEKLFEIVGVDKEDKDELQTFATWLGERFKPVYLAYKGALGNLAPDVPLGEIDDKLPPELGMRLLELVSFPYSGSTPYLVSANPFEGWMSFSIDIDDIKDYVDEVKAKYADAAKKGESTAAKAGEVAGKTIAGGMATGGVNQLKGKDDKKGGTFITVDNAYGIGKKVGASIATGSGAATITSQTSLLTAVIGSELTALETIRMKAYGSERLLVGDAQSIFSLEDGLSKRISFNSAGQAQFNGSYEDIAKEFGSLFGVNNDPQSVVYSQFVNWLRLRFMPVYLNTLSAIKRVSPTAPMTMSLMSIEKTISATQKVTVAKAIIGSDVEYQGDKVSVWKLNETPFGVIQNPTALEESARAYVRLLEQEALSITMKTPDLNRNPGSSDYLGNVIPISSANRTNSAITGYGVRSNNAPTIKGVSLGNQLGSMGGGKGGAWQEVPYPKANKSRDAAMETLTVVGAMTGVSPALLGTIVSIESSFNYSIKASTSSASGWFQFINDTWDMMVKQYGGLYGFPSDPTRTLRLDPRANALMGAEYTKENYNALAKSIGRTPTDTDVYLAHFLGVGGASKFLNADPTAIAAQLFPAAAKANISIFYTLGGQPRTIGEVYQLFDEKVSRHRVGDVGVNMGTAANAQISAPPGSGMPGTPATDNVIKPAGFAEVNAPKTRSVASTAVASVSPIQPTAPVNPFASTPLPNVSTQAPSKGNATPLATVPLAQRQQQASAIDRTQQQQVQETMLASREVVSMLERQLVVQEGMREYLKEIASNIGVMGRSNTPSGGVSKEHQVGKTPPPISMRK